MPIHRRFAIGVLLGMLSCTAWGNYKLPTQQQKVLDRWLADHPRFKAATDADCDCAEDIEQMRTVSDGVWKAIPDYHPYSVSGDLNSDGLLDCAIIVVEKSGSMQHATLLVFNGPFSTGPKKPAFVREDLDMRGRGMFFGPPRPRPYRLLLGGFFSDNADLLVPKGKTYKFTDW
jgi:hypothetical protein